MAAAPFLAKDHALLIDGEWVTSDSWIDVESPYSGEVVGRVPRVGAAETRRALDAAARVLTTPIPAHERAAIGQFLADAVDKLQDKKVGGHLGHQRQDPVHLLGAGEGPVAIAHIGSNRRDHVGQQQDEDQPKQIILPPPAGKQTLER